MQCIFQEEKMYRLRMWKRFFWGLISNDDEKRKNNRKKWKNYKPKLLPENFGSLNSFKTFASLNFAKNFGQKLVHPSSLNQIETKLQNNGKQITRQTRLTHGQTWAPSQPSSTNKLDPNHFLSPSPDGNTLPSSSPSSAKIKSPRSNFLEICAVDCYRKMISQRTSCFYFTFFSRLQTFNLIEWVIIIDFFLLHLLRSNDVRRSKLWINDVVFSVPPKTRRFMTLLFQKLPSTWRY